MNRLFVSFLLGTAFISGVAQAETRYVSDQLVITLRSGPGNQYAITKNISTGAKMEILEEQADIGYAHVRMDDGTDGWVRTQYLTDKPVAKLVLEQLEQRYEKLKEKNSGGSEELKTIKTDFTKLSQDYAKLSKEHKDLTDTVSRMNEVAAKPILLDKENRELKEQNVTLTNEMQLIAQENQILKDRSDRDWFIAGAGVLFAGMLMGLILPKLRTSKKSSWSGGSL